MMITVATVIRHISDVTPAQIGACHKVYGPDNKAFYMVESEQDAMQEYKVTYSKEYGFRCTCKSGQNGFSNVRHASGVCKHVRWSVAAAQEEKAAMTEQALLNVQQPVKASATPVAPVAAWGATEKRASNQINASRENGRCAILAAVAMARC